MALDIDLSTLGLGSFDSLTRLHRLEGDGPLAELLLETWCGTEALNEPWEIHLSALSENARLDHRAMLAQRITLHTLLSDGSEVSRSGIVTSAHARGADGGLARYDLVMQPWLSLLRMNRRSQVWQEKSVIEIVESVFAAHAQHAAWQWADDIAAHLQSSANGGVRSTTVQYRETDFAFVQRLLAEEGIVYRFERDDAAPLGHRVVFLADTVSQQSCPEDPSSLSMLGGQGIRFHRHSPLEEQDAIQAMVATRQMASATVSLLGWDYKGKRAVASSMPTAAAFAGDTAPRLEHYDHAGAYAFADVGQAERAARLAQEAIEARHKTWTAQGTVRTFAAGTQFELTQSTLDDLAALGESPDRRFLVTGVIHAGINNLPLHLLDRSRMQRSADEQRQRLIDRLKPWVPRPVAERAGLTGYGNSATLIRAAVPWRPMLADDTGARLNPKPLVGGPLLATVVGPQGETSAAGGQEIHTDKLGRVRIQYEFQQGMQGEGTSQASTWVRVMQRYAGGGMGLQFVPRIGQQVLVDFCDGDIDRPMVVAAMYTGRGEGGVARTPGGQAGESDTSVFAQSSDHSPSAQGNLAGGNSPAWHGASADAQGHGNASALSGVKSKEFGGQGFNQLVFDDSDQQLRVQLGSTQYGTQLSMGHLIHQADNFRGSFRGLGFELRTDAYGVVRGGRGVLLSTFDTQAAEPAGDNAAGIALASQVATLGEAFSTTANTHESVQMAAHIGSLKASQSMLDSTSAPLKALHTALRGMVDGSGVDAALKDASAKNMATSATKTPHTTDPVLAIAAKAGLAAVAGQDVQMSAGETITLGSGEDTQWAIGGAARIHTGQAIGLLAGAIKPGAEAVGKGITLIAGRGDIEVQAQADAMQVAAKGNVTVQSASAHVDWAAAKRIVMSTAGGANITIEGGNITVQCPGKITVKAGKKSFISGGKTDYVMPVMPSADNSWVKFEGHYDDAWNTGWLLDQVKVDVNRATVHEGISIEPMREGA
ncbi:type VI secretion system Vgr family protein [Piscinibacter terrae]|uniref:Type VI secretion system tip protein VgrG n=1 Tax=Piscinibacter terrae TaxID=2496871 RepID=A0A3N7HSJ8_9BURK|nr:type VI secretion system Vgr family protein [Albitalea terrae]RQP24216.1 type VI secretion system tip protein VgrG [Albitalea terrae]